MLSIYMDSPSENDRQTVAAPPLFPIWKSVVLLLLGGATITACLLTRPPTMAGTPGVTMQLPYRVENYWGYDQAVSYTEKTVLPPDTQFARKNYESSEGDSILCSIILSGVEKRSIHRPEICLPGQGWTIKSSETVKIPLKSGKNLSVMNLTLTRPIDLGPHKKGLVQAYYMYWFVGQNVVTPNHWERIWLTSWDLVVHHINHRWAYVIVSANITDGLVPHGKNGPETLVMLKNFVREILPTFEQVEPKN